MVGNIFKTSKVWNVRPIADFPWVFYSWNGDDLEQYRRVNVMQWPEHVRRDHQTREEEKEEVEKQKSGMLNAAISQ